MKMLSQKSLAVLVCTLAFQALAFDIPTAPSGDSKPAKVKPRPTATAPSTTPAATAVVSGPSGKLVIEADAPCQLRVNGEVRLTLKAAEPKVVVLEAGKQLLECISTQDPSAKVRQIQNVEAGKQDIVSLSIKGATRFSEGTSGTLIDSTTGLQWTQSDNGSDISWPEASAYCKAKGTGWELPAVAQLQALVDSTQSQRCGTSTCGVSPKFRITEWLPWSNEREGSSQAWVVSFENGTRVAFKVGSRTEFRALCVRRP